MRPTLALGQTETPTPAPTTTATETATAVPCTPSAVTASCGSGRLILSWFSKRPDELAISISATHCPYPSACTTTPLYSPVTTAPIEIVITDSAPACRQFTGTFVTPASNSTGCPGGKDSYRSGRDKLRFIFGAETTALAFVHAPLNAPGMAPTLTPPITYRIFDSAGYTLQATLTTCITTQSASSVKLKCF